MVEETQPDSALGIQPRLCARKWQESFRTRPTGPKVLAQPSDAPCFPFVCLTLPAAAAVLVLSAPSLPRRQWGQGMEGKWWMGCSFSPLLPQNGHAFRSWIIFMALRFFHILSSASKISWLLKTIYMRVSLLNSSLIFAKLILRLVIIMLPPSDWGSYLVTDNASDILWKLYPLRQQFTIWPIVLGVS